MSKQQYADIPVDSKKRNYDLWEKGLSLFLLFQCELHHLCCGSSSKTEKRKSVMSD